MSEKCIKNVFRMRFSIHFSAKCADAPPFTFREARSCIEAPVAPSTTWNSSSRLRRAARNVTYPVWRRYFVMRGRSKDPNSKIQT